MSDPVLVHQVLSREGPLGYSLDKAPPAYNGLDMVRHSPVFKLPDSLLTEVDVVVLCFKRYLSAYQALTCCSTVHCACKSFASHRQQVVRQVIRGNCCAC